MNKNFKQLHDDLMEVKPNNAKKRQPTQSKKPQQVKEV